MAVASAATSWVQSLGLGTAPGPAVEADWAGSAVETGSGRACCRGRVGLALLYGPRRSGSDVEAARRHLPCGPSGGAPGPRPGSPTSTPLLSPLSPASAPSPVPRPPPSIQGWPEMRVFGACS